MSKPSSMTPETRIELDEQLTIVEAAAFHGRLCSAAALGAPIVICADRVREIDTAALQLLAGLWQSCRERGIDCAWHEVSETLRRAARLLGMTEALRIPEPTSAREHNEAAA